MAVNNSAWSDSGTPANSAFAEPAINNSAYTETNPANATWARNSGIDTSVPTYDDSTISYDEATEYYDGYAADVITVDDTRFANYTSDSTPSASNWTDNT